MRLRNSEETKPSPAVDPKHRKTATAAQGLLMLALFACPLLHQAAQADLMENVSTNITVPSVFTAVPTFLTAPVPVQVATVGLVTSGVLIWGLNQAASDFSGPAQREAYTALSDEARELLANEGSIKDASPELHALVAAVQQAGAQQAPGSHGVRLSEQQALSLLATTTADQIQAYQKAQAL